MSHSLLESIKGTGMRVESSQEKEKENKTKQQQQKTNTHFHDNRTSLTHSY